MKADHKRLKVAPDSDRRRLIKKLGEAVSAEVIMMAISLRLLLRRLVSS
jgi:hypothetical protein